MRFTAITGVLLLIAACGSRESETAWLPTYDTADNATLAYVTGIETGNLELVLASTAESERASHEKLIREKLEFARQRGFQWKIETVESTAQKHDDHAFIGVRYLPCDEQGNPKREFKEQSSWLAFVKQSDGTWRMSPSKAAEIAQQSRYAKPAGAG